MAKTTDLSMNIFEQKCNVNAMKKELHDGLNPVALDIPIGGLPITTWNIGMTKNVDSIN